MDLPARYALAQLFQPGADIPEPERNLIRDALAAACTVVAPADPGRLHPAEAVRILAEAGRRLTGPQPRWGAALAMAEAAPPDLQQRLPLRMLWLRGLARRGRRDEIAPEIARLLSLEPADPKRDAALVQLSLQLNLFLQLPHLPRLYPILWGAPQTGPAAALATLNLARYRALLSHALLGFFPTLQDGAPDAAQRFADRLAWSLAASHFVKYVTGAEALLRNRSDPPTANNALERLVLDHAEAIHRGIAGSDFSLLELFRDQGRTIILLGSHLGLLEPDLADLGRLGLKSAIVHLGNSDMGRALPGSVVPEIVDIQTSDAPSLPFELLKLTKRLRREQFLIRIYPDGALGDPLRQIEVGGQRIEIGTGAATIGFYGRAQLVFAASRWTGTIWTVELHAGPDLAQARSPDAAVDLLCGFYAERLRAQLAGPPEDIGGYGGVLPRLRAQLG